VAGDYKILAALETINFLIEAKAKIVIMSHLGRPKGVEDDKYSLRHIVVTLGKALGRPVKFAQDCIGTEAELIALELKPGEVLLLENLRFHKEEEKGDKDFAKKLARLGEIYVNDAFGTAHRAHASTSVIAQFFSDKVCGYLMTSELKNADKVLDSPERPYTAIMGGAKIADKILIIEKLLDKVDNLIIGGGMSYTFAKALGGTIGDSLLEDDKLDFVLELMEKAKAKGVTLILPEDTVISKAFANDAAQRMVNKGEIPDDWMGLDIGTKSRASFKKVILDSATILWNGPMGVFEMENFAEGTKTIAMAVAGATTKGAYTLIGGGDSVAAINKYDLAQSVSYVSTGGGAMLEFMEGKILPGIKAILD
jgi:phosphoglycerate kinase